MKFLSYAQNFEDVILNRAFKGQDQGFYLDVGAAHPLSHSVTKNFYDRGWHGINIEPGCYAFGLLAEDRTRDLNLNVGISNAPGKLTFFESPDSLGLSTFNPLWMNYWKTHDDRKFVEKTVEVLTLSEVCERYVHQPIDFLKIDVEGHEPEVLAGADFTRWRPRVVLVEGPRPLYQTKLLESGYLHAAFDGVNHYFVSAEEERLIPLLAKPVSLVIDAFELHETVLERDGHHHALYLLNESRLHAQQLGFELEVTRQSIEVLNGVNSELEMARRTIEVLRAENSEAFASIEQTRAKLLETAAERDELVRRNEVLSQEISLACTIRDELNLELEERLRQHEELSERHEALLAKVAPLIEVKRALQRVDGVFGHPAHRFRMMSSNIRQGQRSTLPRHD